MRIDSKFVALITGGARGLGAACARRLAGNGAKIYVTDQLEPEMEKLVAELGPNSATAVKCDLSQELEVRSLVEACVSKWGALHAVVSCAGIVRYSQTLAPDGSSLNIDTVKQTFTNTVGQALVAKHAAMAMKENALNDRRERGSIVFCSPICATHGLATSLPYLRKAACNAMVLPMARDLSRLGIRVNAILETEMQHEGIRAYGETTPEAVKQFQKDFILKHHPQDAEQGREEHYAAMVETCITNPLLNGAVMPLDGAMRV